MSTNLAILGSTGSIGRQTLDVVRNLPDRFNVVALAAGNNLDLLSEQVREFSPALISTTEKCDPSRFEHCPSVVYGDAGLMDAATFPDADLIVVATTGHSAIRPTLAAVEAGKEIALANKEVVVCAGELLMDGAHRHGVNIRPIDSEHSAIWQCLAARGWHESPVRITLTASGGALREVPIEHLPDVTVDEALAHPNWAMGPKVTIDSATLMNKGLEVIEAHWLFDTPYDQIDVVIHPQSIVHSFVSFVDGSTLAQLGLPDMRVPIQYALTFPDRIPAPDRHLDLLELGSLEFRPPDRARYRALDLAFQAGRAGATFPTVLSAADEVAVDQFLSGTIRFQAMIELVERTLDQHEPGAGPLDLERIQEADRWARAFTRDLIGQLERR